jgi:hypothetical protein
MIGMKEMTDILIKQVENIVEELEEGKCDPRLYLEDALDIQFKIGLTDKEYRGADVVMNSHSPFIYIDTQSKTVVGKWGDHIVELDYKDNIGLDDVIKEHYCYFIMMVLHQE